MKIKENVNFSQLVEFFTVLLTLSTYVPNGNPRYLYDTKLMPKGAKKSSTYRRKHLTSAINFVALRYHIQKTKRVLKQYKEVLCKKNNLHSAVLYK